MRFKKRTSDEPSIDIIPMIDVLMAILIFLMLTTTFNKFTEMQLQLPTADTEAARDYPKEVVITISSEGRYAINKQPLDNHSTDGIAAADDAAMAPRHARSHQGQCTEPRTATRAASHGAQTPVQDQCRTPAPQAHATQERNGRASCRGHS